MRRMAASAPASTTVFERTLWSYWRWTQRLLAMLGEDEEAEERGGSGRPIRGGPTGRAAPSRTAPGRARLRGCIRGLRRGCSTGRAPTSRSPSMMWTRWSSVTWPMIVQGTSQRSKRPATSSSWPLRTMISMRSWDSESMTSYGVIPSSRRGTFATSMTMPVPPRVADSTREAVRPAAPRSWMPVIQSAWLWARSRQASRSIFSRKGLPTWTAGRSSSKRALRVGAGSEAGRAVDAVAAGVGADEHEDVAGALGLRAGELVDAGDADAHGVDERVRGVARPRRRLRRRRWGCRGSCRSRRCRRRRRRRDSGCAWVVPSASFRDGPKRRESRRAIGRAPIAKMSRTMPPTPVAAPW